MNQEIIARLEESFLDVIPADGVPKLVGAYFLGLYSRYASDIENLKDSLKSEPDNIEIQEQIQKYEFFLKELKGNINHLIPKALTES